MYSGSVEEPDPGVERRDDVVIEREREREQRPGQDGREDERQRDVAERAERRRSEVARRLLELRVHARGPGPDDDGHIADAERDLGEHELGERAARPEGRREEDQQAQAHDDLGGHHRQQEERLGGGAAAEPDPGEGQAQERADGGRDDDDDEREPERHRQRVEQLLFWKSVGYQSRVKPFQLTLRSSR